MIYGVVLSLDNDFAADVHAVDTYATYGLGLLVDDLSISAPEVRTDTITVRGMDGVLDVSDAPQGFPVFNDRTIKFKLVKLPRPYQGMDIVELMQLRTRLMADWQGKRIRIILPDDPTHYWSGRMTVGGLIAGEGIIECQATVYPYKLKNTVTEVELDGLTTSWKTFHLQNERRYVVPEITFSQNSSIQIMSGPLAVPPVVELTVPEGELSGQVKTPDFLLMDGSNEIRAKLAAATSSPYLAIVYREGTF